MSGPSAGTGAATPVPMEVSRVCADAANPLPAPIARSAISTAGPRHSIGPVCRPQGWSGPAAAPRARPEHLAHHRRMGTQWAVRARRAFDGERFLPAGVTVVVDGDRIVGVEPAEAGLPDDVPITEVEGTLLPGLVDCHVHLVASGAFPG